MPSASVDGSARRLTPSVFVETVAPIASSVVPSAPAAVPSDAGSSPVAAVDVKATVAGSVWRGVDGWAVSRRSESSVVSPARLADAFPSGKKAASFVSSVNSCSGAAFGRRPGDAVRLTCTFPLWTLKLKLPSTFE
ncbi:MAG: hypothetical protein AVDCRST_MAG87-2903 [uncultured Thermomicrobiales bacterium]|uniref:Uncharacterized protein n=1 Tax=uncultured Thermomicrobiales bacterium TaxID=1645740 RepID=A0A6J4VHX9_9BACT|nr:MAG: hypothetical protein AVDCRST_MAG87-2903 [uncultured Thermomicrobiales bacterium]